MSTITAKAEKKQQSEYTVTLQRWVTFYPSNQ